MSRVAVLAGCLLTLTAASAHAQRADSARAATVPVGTVIRVTLETTTGRLVAIGAVSALRDAQDCLHLTLAEESETSRFGIQLVESIPVDRMLGTPRPDGSVPADPRWVPVPLRVLTAAGIGCIQGD